MTEQNQDRPASLASLLAYAEREHARRARGWHLGRTPLQDGELAALLDVLRPQGETAETQETAGQ